MSHAFKLFDKNENGYISKEEFIDSFQNFGVQLNKQDTLLVW